MTDGTVGPEETSEHVGTDDGSVMDAPGVPVRSEPRIPSTDEKLELVHRHALLAAATASGMKGEDIRILDVHDLVTYTDFLVLCSGRSSRQAGRIAEEIALKLKKELGIMPSSVEGERPGEWILLDFLDFIVHVFTPEARDFYRLDVLWKQAPVEVIE
jgi:ribosome-associated protein